MQRVEIILPSLLTLFGAVILWQSVTQMDYFYAERGAPGPGFLSFWVSLGVVILGLVVVIRELRIPIEKKVDVDWPHAAGRRRILQLIGGFIVFLAAMPVVGFVIPAILFMIVVSRLLGMRPWSVLCISSVLIGLFIHLVFETWLRLSLPKGYLGDALGGLMPWIF